MKCEGSCDIHEGAIQEVNVYDTESDTDWGNFFYCEEAIKEDIRRGFKVTLLGDKQDD